MYEDGNVLAILDIRPSAPGHTLIIPKEHAATIHDISEDIINSLFVAVEEVMEKLERGLDPDGFNVGWNHGKAAGQAVPHLHIHVMPRFEGDKGGPVQAVVRNEPEEDISNIARKIRSGEKPPKQRSKFEKKTSKSKGSRKEKSPQQGQLEKTGGVPGPSREDLTGEEGKSEKEKEQEEEEDQEKEEEDEKNKSAKKKWKEMKKPDY